MELDDINGANASQGAAEKTKLEKFESVGLDTAKDVGKTIDYFAQQ
jgi:hypothetical protein